MKKRFLSLLLALALVLSILPVQTFAATEVVYGSWSGWSDNPVYASDTIEVETRSVFSYTSYHMGHYCTGNLSGSANDYQTSYSNNTTNTTFNNNCSYHSLGWFSNLNDFYYFDDQLNVKNYLYKGTTTSNCYKCSNTCYRWYILDEEDHYKTQYRSRTVTRITSYVVQLDPTGGSVTPTSMTVYPGQMYGTLPTPTRDGYSFEGWYLKSTGSLVTSTTKVAVSSDNEVLQAHWYKQQTEISSDSCGENLTWDYDSTTGTLTISGTGAMSNWISREDVPWYAYSGSIKTIILPNGLTSIGASAFENCRNLQSVTIPSTVETIESKAFYGCSSLTSVVIPDNVILISKYAFQKCASLTSATIGNKVEQIEDGVFRNCDKLASVTVQNPQCDFFRSSSTLGDPAITKIIAVSGSTAEQYAKDFGYAFQALGSQFTDVPSSAFYAQPVSWAVANGVTSGVSKDRFAPTNTCTRAQVVTFLWRAKGQPEPGAAANPFTDVAPSAYYYKAVLWAVENGITSGVSKDRFAPNQGCTRGQVVTFLWRTENQPAPGSTASPFTDVPANAYYYKAVLWAVERKITAGTSKTTFAPNNTCTRAQIVTFLFRDLG